MKQLPTLFKRTSLGAQQEWTIGTLGNVIVTTWGQTGGAIQETRDVIREGKNANRANATTPEEQAALEAQSQWEKKLKRGYVRDPQAAMAGEVDEIIEGGISPMLAHVYEKHASKIFWPAYAQPKLDGHRCIATMEKGRATLWSRTRKRITGVPHIERAVEALVHDGVVLDGELYHHDYRDRFEELTSFIRQEEPKEGHEVVQYHVYDLPSWDGSFESRFSNLRKIFGTPPVFRGVHLVETRAVREDELIEAFNAFVAQGYEGAMIRNADAPYEYRRSYGLQKLKTFPDNEFPVVRVEEGRGKLAGHAIFVCRTEGGQYFNVKMAGELAELKKYWENPSLAVGKLLTVRYQGFTGTNGVPRFPVGLRLRADL